MKKLMLAGLLGLITATAAQARACDRTVCYQAYAECLQQGVPQATCYQAYLACVRDQCSAS